MSEEKQYTSLKKLVDKQFTIQAVKGYQYKKYDPESRRMLTSDKWEQGYSKRYGVETNHGYMDVSAGQLGNMLEAVQKHGVADLRNKTFHVKSNGKEGMDIRYFLNFVHDAPIAPPKEAEQVFEPTDKPVDLSDIPF